MADLLIEYRLPDGEERSERWPSVERFRAWAQAEGLRLAWTAYTEDEDGEWALVERGRIGARGGEGG